MPHSLILGTAGHIDHGKTALVRALTGVDTDRLPEEKRRGITIQLGFAELELGEFRLGIVDVPGHERFVRNMLAGATGIDLALLVVAADDSVKPQTREHLEILRLLRLEHGVIALTKCDLADDDWIDLVEEEVRGLVADTFLAAAPVVRTSTETGAGLDELRERLAEAAARAAASTRASQTGGPFRMAIDRSFTIAGHGTVVTGSVGHGTAKVGDELVIEPIGRSVRVRGVQNHDRPAESVSRGQRAAINLAGVRHDELGQGHELASPGFLRPSKLLSVRIHLVESAPRPLKHRARVRVHLGTAELMAAVVLLDRDLLEQGDEAVAQLFLRSPAVCTWDQPLVLRSESPVTTIGGGTVLDPHAAKIRRRDTSRVARLASLSSDNTLRRASAALYFAGFTDWQPSDLTGTAGIDDTEAATAALIESGELIEFRLSQTRTMRVHRDVVIEAGERIETWLAAQHDANPLAVSFDRARLVQHFLYLGDAHLIGAILERIGAAGEIVLSQRGVALAGRGPQLSKNEHRLLDEIVARFREEEYQPPSIEDIQAGATRNQASVPQLIELAVADGRLVRIAPGMYLDGDAERRMRALLAERLREENGLTVSRIREILNTSRKFAVPICEYLDEIGFTKRNGDVRVLAEDKQTSGT